MVDDWDDELDRRTDELFAGLRAGLDDFADGPAPAEIRRRGDRRRTRRRIAVGATTVGVVALSVVGGVTLDHDGSRPPTTVDPAASSTPTTGPSIRTSQQNRSAPIQTSSAPSAGSSSVP